MDYFVSIENSPYYHWQTELLIESFKHHHHQDKLVIAIANKKIHTNLNFTRNLNSHPRIFSHENIGNIRGYYHLNGLYALANSLQSGKLHNPFVIIPPDVVLFRRLEFKQSSYPQIIFSPDPFFTIEVAEKEIGPFWEWENLLKADFEKNWMLLGTIMICSNLPNELIYEVISMTEKLATHQLLAGKEISPKTHLLAWTMIINKYHGHISLFGDYSLVMPMMSSGNAAFVSYEKGMPPIFHKSMFTYTPPYYSALGNPFVILKNNFPTPNSHYLSKLASCCG